MTAEMMLNIGLSTAIAIFGWVLKNHTDEVQASINIEII